MLWLGQAVLEFAHLFPVIRDGPDLPVPSSSDLSSFIRVLRPSVAFC